MKRIKGIAIIILSIMFITSNLQVSFAFNKGQIPQYVEVGLFYGNTAKSTLELKAVNGFDIGVLQGGSFRLLMDLLEHQQIILRKDAYYIGQGSNFVEYTGDIKNISNLSNVQGPYHVQVGGDFQNQKMAHDFIKSLGALGNDLYFVYEGNWKVFTGQYINEEEATIKARAIEKETKHKAKVVQPSSTRVQVLDAKGKPIFFFDAREDIYFKEIEDKGRIPLVEVEGRRYRGAITAKRLQNSDMSVVNRVLLEEYLYGVVPGEMPALWHIEALKAQAVAARNFAIANMNKFRQLGFDVCNTTSSQVYGGYNVEHTNSNRAVEETRSIVVTHNGQLISAFYHSNSGGHTENSENVWANPVPYIRGVKDDYSLGVDTSTWSKTLTKEEVKRLLQQQGIHIGDIIDIKIEEASQFGRVLSLTVYGTRGKETLLKERSRQIFGLRSTWFNVEGGGNNSITIRSSSGTSNSNSLLNKTVISANSTSKIDNISNIKMYNGKNYKGINEQNTGSFVFNGKGFGHGLGMSQHGARKMAEAGFDFKEILKHYYTGVKVE